MYIIELLSNGILHITGVCINCKKKMSANEDKSEIARTADVASELSKMQLVCTCIKFIMALSALETQYCRPHFQESPAVMKRTLIQIKIHHTLVTKSQNGSH